MSGAELLDALAAIRRDRDNCAKLLGRCASIIHELTACLSVHARAVHATPRDSAAVRDGLAYLAGEPEPIGSIQERVKMRALLTRIRDAMQDANGDDFFDGAPIAMDLDELLGTKPAVPCAACGGAGEHRPPGQPPIRCVECSGWGTVS